MIESEEAVQAYLESLLNSVDKNKAISDALVANLKANAKIIDGVAYIPTGQDGKSLEELMKVVADSYDNIVSITVDSTLVSSNSQDSNEINNMTFDQRPDAIKNFNLTDCPVDITPVNPKYTKKEVEVVVDEVVKDCEVRGVTSKLLEDIKLPEVIKAKCDIVLPIPVEQPDYLDDLPINELSENAPADVLLKSPKTIVMLGGSPSTANLINNDQLTDKKQVINNENTVIGRVNDDGIAFDKNGNNIGKVVDDRKGVRQVINATGQVIGQTDDSRVAISNIGDIIGKVNLEDKVVDDEGNIIGKVVDNNKYVKLVTNDNEIVIGKVINNANAKQVINNEKAVIGQADDNGTVIDNAGNIIGKVIREDTAIDNSGNIIGKAIREDTAIDNSGNIIGEVNGGNNVIDNSDNIIGKANNDNNVIDNSGNIIGKVIREDTVIDNSGNIIGNANSDNNVIDNSDNIIGKVIIDDNVIDNSGNIIGKVINNENKAGPISITKLKNVGDVVTCGEPILIAGGEDMLCPVKSGVVTQIYVGDTAKPGDKLFMVEEAKPDDVVNNVMEESEKISVKLEELAKLKGLFGNLEPIMYAKKMIYGIYEGQYLGYIEYYESFNTLVKQRESLNKQYNDNLTKIKNLAAETNLYVVNATTFILEETADEKTLAAFNSLLSEQTQLITKISNVTMQIDAVASNGFAISKSGDILGNVNVDEDVLDDGGNIIGKVVDNRDFMDVMDVVNAAGEVIGQANASGVAIDKAGNTLGKVNADAKVVDGMGNIMGEVFGNRDIKDVRQVINASGEVIGQANDKGVVINNVGNILGKVNAESKVINSGGSIIGKVVDNRDNRDIRYVKDVMTVINAAGEVIGQANDKGVAIDKAGNILGKVNADAKVINNRGSIIGKVVGNRDVKDVRQVINAAGEVIGQANAKKPMLFSIDKSNQSLASIVTKTAIQEVEVSVSEDGLTTTSTPVSPAGIQYSFMPFKTGNKKIIKSLPKILGDIANIVVSFSNNVLFDKKDTSKWIIEPTTTPDINKNDSFTIPTLNFEKDTTYTYYFNNVNGRTKWVGSFWQVKYDFAMAAIDLSNGIKDTDLLEVIEQKIANIQLTEKDLPNIIQRLGNGAYNQIVLLSKNIGYYQLSENSILIKTGGDIGSLLLKKMNDSKKIYEDDYAEYLRLRTKISEIELEIEEFPNKIEAMSSSSCVLPEAEEPTATYINGDKVNIVKTGIDNIIANINIGQAIDNNGNVIGNIIDDSGYRQVVDNGGNVIGIINAIDQILDSDKNVIGIVVKNKPIKKGKAVKPKPKAKVPEVREDINFKKNPPPISPPITTLKYWKKYCKRATTVNLLPMYWPVGLLIPTPGPLLKIPMPIIWKPLVVIPNPIALVVIGIAVCGICPAPFIYICNPGWPFPIGMVAPKASWHTAGLRGPKKIAGETTSKPLIAAIPSITMQLKYKKDGVITKKPVKIDAMPVITKLLPLVQDDLPAFERLSLSNLPYLMYLMKWCKAGKKTMGFFENP